MQSSSVAGRVLTANAVNTHNTFEQLDLMQPAVFDVATLTETSLSIDLPAKSVVMLELT